MKNSVLWVVTQCSYGRLQCFGGTCSLQLKGQRVSQSETCRTRLCAYAGVLLGLLFDPEDGGDIFLWNTGLPLNYRTQSLSLLWEPQIQNILVCSTVQCNFQMTLWCVLQDCHILHVCIVNHITAKPVAAGHQNLEALLWKLFCVIRESSLPKIRSNAFWK
jgi:hypothetical protein